MAKNRLLRRLEKSLSEIEDDDWGDPPQGATALVARVHALRHAPIGTLSPGDLRILIGQGIGLAWVVPLALDLLENDPCVEGDLYPGDLHAAVAGVAPEHWSRHADQAERFSTIPECAE